jgi:glycine/D-amino acid oxidase-like deaminating enzyme
MATGHFCSGILLTPITARLIGEWINGTAREPGLRALQPIAIFSGRDWCGRSRACLKLSKLGK